VVAKEEKEKQPKTFEGEGVPRSIKYN